MGNNGASIWMDTPAGQQLQSRFSDESTLHALDNLLAKISTLEQAVDNLTVIMQQGPGMVSMLADMTDDTIKQAADQGIDIEERVKIGLQLASKITNPSIQPKLDGLLSFVEQGEGFMAMLVDTTDEIMRSVNDRGLDMQAISNTTGKLGTALSQTANTPIPKVGGIFSLIRALRDPDRQKAIGWLLNLTKALGKQL